MMLCVIIIGRLILGQGVAPIDFNGIGVYGPLGFFVLYLIYREYKSDDEKAEMRKEHNKYVTEDRAELLAKLDKSTQVIERLEKKLEK